MQYRAIMGHCFREVTYYRYKNVDLYLQGIKDFLKGPAWLMEQDGEALHKSVMAAGYRGQDLNTLDVPMMKGSNGIIAIDTDETKEQPCIKCGRCVDVCPMELSPLYFVKYAKDENWQGMKDMNVMDCVECRCCQYICSSKIPIINSIKAGKNAVRGMK